jgi:hypothetical protein
LPTTLALVAKPFSKVGSGGSTLSPSATGTSGSPRTEAPPAGSPRCFESIPPASTTRRSLLVHGSGKTPHDGPAAIPSSMPEPSEATPVASAPPEPSATSRTVPSPNARTWPSYLPQAGACRPVGTTQASSMPTQIGGCKPQLAIELLVASGSSGCPRLDLYGHVGLELRTLLRAARGIGPGGGVAFVGSVSSTTVAGRRTPRRSGSTIGAGWGTLPVAGRT